MKDNKEELFKYLVIKLARNNKITVAECDEILNAGKEYANQEAEKAFNAARVASESYLPRTDQLQTAYCYPTFKGYLNSRKDG